MNIEGFKPKHVLHSAISHPLLRDWQSSKIEITAKNIMFPIFVSDKDDAADKIDSLPGVYRVGIRHLESVIANLVSKGLSSVLLFGVLCSLDKDSNGTHADSNNSPVIKAIYLLKEKFPNLLIACDVCLCSYTSHGHCGIFDNRGNISNQMSVQRIAQIAVNYAKAGAHIVAPSDMMDGRVATIKQGLYGSGLQDKVAVLSYSAKFASVFYGPFREAAFSAPEFGDRRCYQLPPGSSGLAARAVGRDIEEGADMLMVKPAMPYLDVIRNTKNAHPEYPLFAYQVSGEYAMLYHASTRGSFVLEDAVMESLICIRRAGADCIITYYAPLILDILGHATPKL